MELSTEADQRAGRAEESPMEEKNLIGQETAAQNLDGTPEEKEANEEKEESQILASLAAEVQDQDEVERTINRQAAQMLDEQAIGRDEKRLERAQADKDKLEGQVRKAQSRLSSRPAPGSATTLRLQAEIDHYRAQMQALDTDIAEIKARIEERQAGLAQEQPEQSGNQRLPNESQHEFLVRTGKITPFSKVGGGLKRTETTLRDALFNAEEGDEEEELEKEAEAATDRVMSHRVLLKPGFAGDDLSELSDETIESDRPVKRRKIEKELLRQEQEQAHEHDEAHIDNVASSETGDDDAYEPGLNDRQLAATEETDDEAVVDSDDSLQINTPGSKRKQRSRQSKKTVSDEQEDLRGLDDGKESLYQDRLQKWAKRRRAARAQAQSQDTTANTPTETPDLDEWHMPHPTVPDVEYENGFRLPGDIHPSLFDYQKTGVQWLSELYSRQVGGIVGDEMGLGKTIQAISFLAGLHYSKKMVGPAIIVAPATVMKQWVNEFHTWWPPFRVSILHTSGSGMIDLGRESKREDELLNRAPGRQQRLTKTEKAAKKIVDRVVQDGHILVTTYSGLQSYADLLIPVNWEYAVLDEGHKIRNPNAGITLFCKQLRTPNRIILSGTPMQNNLMELWSLFDFIFPMRLGNLVDFKNQFEIPIRIGGYANASNLQIQTAGKCAETLKDAISPYLLQRMKVDVAADLPQKTEKTLSCKLTKQQRQAYEGFLNGDDVRSIMNGRRQVLYGVDILRKICNHPDLADHKTLATKPGYDYGAGHKSGKMVVVRGLLDFWSKRGHKTLLFAQHRIMLDILEKYLKSMSGINYRRMDGTTPISARQPMVDEFNNNPDAHVFLLTTKVGGLGVNLTGADRVIIFDPDWNPSTDVQARERAWRLGQKREVEIYRLLSGGTIEEKIYQRQIFKQFLTNKVLRDPTQRQTFHGSDLHDLFSLGTQDGETETGKMFAGTETRFESSEEAQTQAPHQDMPLTSAPPAAPAAQTEDLTAVAGIASIQPYTAPADDTDASPSSTPQPTDTSDPSTSATATATDKRSAHPSSTTRSPTADAWCAPNGTRVAPRTAGHTQHPTSWIASRATSPLR